MLVWHLCQDSRHSPPEAAGQHIAAAHVHSPDRHQRMEKATGEEMPTMTQPHRRQELRPHMREAATDLFTSTLHNMTFTPTWSCN